MNSLKFIIQSNIGGGEPGNAAREAKTTISFMNPDPTKKATSRWGKTRVLKHVDQLHWSRRPNTESATAGGKTEKEDQLVFRMLTFIRSNPLGVRGPKDVIVL